MPTGPGRGDVDRLKAPVRERLDGGGQARNADPEPGVEGDLDLRHRRQAAVHLRVGAHHLDLEAGHAPLAYLLDRPRHPVGRADAVGEQRHPGPVTAVALAPGARRAGRRGDLRELGLLGGEEGRRRGVGDDRDARFEHALSGAERRGRGRPRVARRPPSRRARRSPGAACARGPGEARRNSAAWLKPSSCINSSRAVSSSACRPTAPRHASSRQRASSGARSLPIGPWRASASRSSRPTILITRAGSTRGAAVAVVGEAQRPDRQRDRRVGPLGGAALRAAGRHRPLAEVLAGTRPGSPPGAPR